jgi:predicted secreted Zn-dependent protease
MKMRTIPALVALSLTALAAVAADDASTWERMKGYTIEQKDAAVAEAKKMITATDKEIDELAAAGKQSGAEAKAAHRQNMKELVEKKKAAQAELDKLEKSSGNAWEATKAGFASAYQDLKGAYHKAVDSGK